MFTYSYIYVTLIVRYLYSMYVYLISIYYVIIIITLLIRPSRSLKITRPIQTDLRRMRQGLVLQSIEVAWRPMLDGSHVNNVVLLASQLGISNILRSVGSTCSLLSTEQSIMCLFIGQAVVRASLGLVPWLRLYTRCYAGGDQDVTIGGYATVKSA